MHGQTHKNVQCGAVLVITQIGKIQSMIVLNGEEFLYSLAVAKAVTPRYIGGMAFPDF